MGAARLKAPIVTHAQARCLERYGMSLSNADIIAILSMIHENRGKLVERGRDGTSLWKVRYRKVDMYPLLSVDLWKIITFKVAGYQRHTPQKRVKTYRNRVEKWGNRYG